MSAESNLAGLYPPIQNDIWDTDLEWQPIPVHTIPEKEDAVSIIEILLFNLLQITRVYSVLFIFAVLTFFSDNSDELKIKITKFCKYILSAVSQCDLANK